MKKNVKLETLKLLEDTDEKPYTQEQCIDFYIQHLFNRFIIEALVQFKNKNFLDRIKVSTLEEVFRTTLTLPHFTSDLLYVFGYLETKKKMVIDKQTEEILRKIACLWDSSRSAQAKENWREKLKYSWYFKGAGLEEDETGNS